MRPARYAIIPSNGRECLRQCVDAILPQVDHVTIVRTDRTTLGWEQYITDKSGVLTVLPEDINISRWWNGGLDFLELKHTLDEDTGDKYDVAILNDDTIVPEGWFDAVAGKMREMRAVAACSGGSGMPVLHTHSGPVPLHTRMQGFAFVLAGEQGLRADEQFRWYCGDDDLGWRAAQAGGMVMIPGFHVQHLYPNAQVTPEIHELIAKDMQSFVDKWKTRPW
jgi:GT2 family glycosyltransferase